MTWSPLSVERHEPGVDDTALYRLAGVFTDSQDGYAFLERVREEVNARVGHVVVNLEQVPHLTSGGIGLLCAAFMSLHNAGGRMTLVGLAEKHRSLLGVVGLLDRLTSVETEAEALAKPSG